MKKNIVSCEHCLQYFRISDRSKVVTCPHCGTRSNDIANSSDPVRKARFTRLVNTTFMNHFSSKPAVWKSFEKLEVKIRAHIKDAQKAATLLRAMKIELLNKYVLSKGYNIIRTTEGHSYET